MRPALKLNLESVIFSSNEFTLKTAGYDVTLTPASNMTKTSASGDASQSGLSGAMTSVVYTANDGYYFPMDYSVEAVNGITVTRDSYTQITVSGTPTADAEIILTAPTEKTTPDTPTAAAAVNCTTADNNDGKLTGVMTAMEYKKSDAESWTAGTGNDITGLVPGTYYVRVKATDTANASANQELAIEEYSAATYAVTITSASNMTKTTDSGAASQTGLSGEMTDVVYTANDGYYFPTDYSVEAVNGITVTRDSYTQITVSGTPTADAEITLTAPTEKTTPDAPTAAAAENCTTEDNNDGKLTGVTTAMEYKKSDAESWTAGTGDDITGLVPGTYYVRVKATDTANASANQELTIEESVKQDISYTVTFKVVNGSWNDGTTADKTVTLTGVEGDTLKLTAENIPAAGSKPGTNYKAGSWDITPSADTEITEDTTYTYTYQQKGNITATITFKVVNGSWDDGKTANKTEILTGKEGSTLKLTAAQIPGVGTKPNDGYKEGSWDVTPVAGSAISGNKTYTYTYAAKNAAEVTKAPTAQTLTANGSAQELVTAGEAKGGTMYYAVTDNDQAPEAAKYTTTIPTGTDAGTYYVWYKAVGDAEYTDSKAASIRCTIAKSDEKPAPSTETPTAVVDENGKMHVYVDGKEDNTYEGLAKQESAGSNEGHYIYVKDGAQVEDKYGFVEYNGGTFLVAWGEVATGANSLQIDPDHPDVWYFCANGQAQTQFTGLAMYEDEWFWLENGRLDTNKNALVEYNGGLFYVGAGRLIREVTGLCMDPNSDDWYFIAYGEVQVNYTGLIMYDGKWFYVTNGKLDVNYTGTVTYDGAEFNVINGMVY